MRGSSVQSRHRNIFAKPAQSAEQFRNVAQGSLYLENSPLRANASLVCFPCEPRGAIAVLPNKPHAIADSPGCVLLSSPANGLDLSPFGAPRLALALEDGSVAVVALPEQGPAPGEQLTEATTLLAGHEKRALGVVWHPSVEGLLASHDASKTVKLWDVASGAAAFSSAPLAGLVTSIAFDGAGQTAIVFAKGGLELFDVRADAKAVASTRVHEGAKGGTRHSFGRVH